MTEGLTVVVVALLGGTATESCVKPVRTRATQVVVVSRGGIVRTADGRVIGHCSNLSIPAKRQRAVELAQTSSIALLEDTVIPDDTWADAVLAGLASGAVACGGPVWITPALPPSTQALALSEYGVFGPGRPAGDARRLPGCNFAFRRDILLHALDGSPGLVDLDVFRELLAHGRKMQWVPGMSVRFTHPFPGGARLKTRFAHGRLHAGFESKGASAAARMARAAKALLLPPVLTARALGGQPWPPAATFGWLVLQQTAWAAGELAGAVAGPPRSGFSQWR